MNVFRRAGTELGRILSVLALVSTTAVQAESVTVNLVDGNGAAVEGFRWVLQEDTTWAVDPNNPGAITGQLALNFHKSHHPIAQYLAAGNNSDLSAHVAGQGTQGYTDGSSVTINDVPAGRYYLSVLPYADHAMGGAPAVIPVGGSANVTVTAQTHPIPTAQIAIYLFQDCYPLNGAPDLPEEEVGSGACADAIDFTKFNVVLEDPGGKYGHNGGPMLQNAFGDPLGTSYLQTCDATGANPGTGTDNCLNVDGTPVVDVLGDGTLAPNADGTLLVKNLAPGKYGVIVTPPTGAGWTQTSTIEGTPVIDAWVKANEPPFFVEFGPPGPHVFIGFTKQRNDFATGTGVATLSGTITDMHMSRPIDTTLYSGRPFPQCWIAINDNNGVPGVNRYAMPCNGDSSFSITNVPAGSYELKVFDEPLDVVIATMAFTVDPTGTCNGGQSCAFGEVPVFNWFNRLTNWIFNDSNQNGLWDVGETNLGAESGPINVRWRDGTVYQSFPTDFDGVAPFDESFPWFNWMVAEVGFTNKKATGVTVVVDAGGPINNDPTLFPGFQEPPGIGEIAPQAQSENGGLPWRTETGPVLTQAFQGFLGQTNYLQWGKTDYVTSDFSSFPPKYVGENGGISGIVFNSVTRAENNPALGVGEGWEPGVPRVQVNLYADGDIDSPVLPPIGQPIAVWPNGIGDVDWNGNGTYDADDDQIDDVNMNGRIDLADVDNYPLGNFPGPEDINRCAEGSVDASCDEFYPAPLTGPNYTDGFDHGDAVAVAWTDSWDDNNPTECQGSNQMAAVGVADNRCFDGMRNWNQVRPGVFDGGYAFNDYDHPELTASNPDAEAKLQEFYNYVNTSVANADKLYLGLLPSDYIVEATTPPGYKAMREHHKNVDFGDAYTPSLQALPPACVGDQLEVPPYFAISTKDGSGAADMLIPGVDPLEAEAPFAGQVRPVCDKKKLALNAAQNAAADFFLVSDVPVAANVTGIILNDLANEFNPNSPNFGEKYAPPLVPVAFYDWQGKEVNRVYADEYGAYNAMLPSTWSANLPQPSGMGPNMVMACMNDAGPIPDGNGNMIIDPHFNPNFSQFCYTFQFMPGSTTYLDTPVLANAAFTSPTSYPVDCEIPTRTPMIASVERHGNSGGGGPFVVNNTPQPQRITIRSRGLVEVPNPDWDGTNATPRTITRDYRFAGSDNVVLIDPDGGVEIPLTLVNPSNQNNITAQVPTNTPTGEYQVIVRSDYSDGRGFQDAPMGVTLTVGVCQGAANNRQCNGTEVGMRLNGDTYQVHTVASDGTGDFTTIQQAIDFAEAGDLILIAPGSYDELLVMWKPVKLQGWGADHVILNARQFPTEKVLNWRNKLDALLTAGLIDMLPGQANAAGFAALGAPAFATAEGAGIFVAGKSTGPNRFNILRNRGARIDGLTIIGASNGGGIVVNGYAGWMNIGNNVLTANSGIYGGGIRLGEPGLVVEDPALGLIYTDAVNDRVRIHHNRVVKNGATEGGAGGGISLYTGADQYRVENNWVCGNFTQGNGGGIAHMGLSNGGRIEHNEILFNESFSQATAVNGGGIFIGGQTPLQAHAGTGLLLTDGTGNVVVNANRINGNLAGAGDGGGIAIVSASGVDVADNLATNTAWYDIGIYNNMITNNVAGNAGAISIQDAVETHIQNNTITHNDSTATAALAFTPGFPNQSNAQPAGVVSRVHTASLAALLQLVADADIPTNGGDLEGYRTFSDANINNDIVFGNRSFYWLNYDDPNTAIVETGLFPANCTTPPVCNLTDIVAYSDDLAVLDGAVDTGEVMFVRASLLTDNPENTTEYTHASLAFTTDPLFVNPVFNEGKNGLDIVEFTVLQTAGAFDEGGNFIQVAFGPLSVVDTGTDANGLVQFDYHLGAGSPAIDQGQNVGLNGVLGQDYDGDARPNGGLNDIGADER